MNLPRVNQERAALRTEERPPRRRVFGLTPTAEVGKVLRLPFEAIDLSGSGPF